MKQKLIIACFLTGMILTGCSKKEVAPDPLISKTELKKAEQLAKKWGLTMKVNSNSDAKEKRSDFKSLEDFEKYLEQLKGTNEKNTNKISYSSDDQLECEGSEESIDIDMIRTYWSGTFMRHAANAVPARFQLRTVYSQGRTDVDFFELSMAGGWTVGKHTVTRGIEYVTATGVRCLGDYEQEVGVNGTISYYAKYSYDFNSVFQPNRKLMAFLTYVKIY